MPPMLVRCDRVSKFFEMDDTLVRALENVSFSIETGDYVAIMGPSGSGKSTLLNLIGCLDTPSRGDIYIDGTNVTDFTADELAAIRNCKIGFVFQRFQLLPRLTALDNVALPLLYAGHGPSERRESAAEKLVEIGLADRLHHMPSQLSGGQQQRVAIARALVTEAPLLLADEPTGAIDSGTGESLLDLFAGLNRRGHTIVMVTHDAEVAGRARRILEIRDGQLSADRASTDNAALPRRAEAMF